MADKPGTQGGYEIGLILLRYHLGHLQTLLLKPKTTLEGLRRIFACMQSARPEDASKYVENMTLEEARLFELPLSAFVAQLVALDPSQADAGRSITEQSYRAVQRVVRSIWRDIDQHEEWLFPSAESPELPVDHDSLLTLAKSVADPILGLRSPFIQELFGIRCHHCFYLVAFIRELTGLYEDDEFPAPAGLARWHNVAGLSVPASRSAALALEGVQLEHDHLVKRLDPRISSEAASDRFRHFWTTTHERWDR